MQGNKWLILYFGCLLSLFFVSKKYIYDVYLIESHSMNNTLRDGDKILIDKFSKEYHRNEIFVFSKFNDTYIKRCIGLPGDTIRMINGSVYANHNKVNFPSSVLTKAAVFEKGSTEAEHMNLFVFSYYRQKWDESTFGPYIVPYKGMAIFLTEQTLKIYRKTIIEENSNLSETDLLGKNYQFKDNYYFVLGDNRLKSKDSRMFGPISERTIIGKAKCLLYSKKNFIGGKFFASIP